MDFFKRKKHNLPLLKTIKGIEFYGYKNYADIDLERLVQLKVTIADEIDLGLNRMDIKDMFKTIANLNDAGKKSEIGALCLFGESQCDLRTSFTNHTAIADKMILLKNEPIKGGPKWLEKKRQICRKHPEVMFFFVITSGRFLKHLKLLEDSWEPPESLQSLLRLEDQLKTLISLRTSEELRIKYMKSMNG